MVIQEAKEKGISLTPHNILYTTLEPCSQRSNPTMKDCATEIIQSGIQHVVYAAFDSEFSLDTAKRFKEAGISYRQVNEEEIIEKSKDLFNSTITVGFDDMELSRKEKL